MSDPFPPNHQLASLVHELVRGPSTDSDMAIATGHAVLDEALHGGLRPGQVAVIAGAAGVGTSTFALGLARNAAVRQRTRTAFIAPDSSEREVLTRVIAAEARLPVSHLRGGHLDDSDRSKLDRHREDLSKAPLLVDAGWPIGGSTPTLLDSARAAVSRGARFVILDGISGAEPQPRDLIKRLRALALTHRTAVAVVSKATLPDHRLGGPALEDLRDHEQMSDLVDLVLMLHRDDLHDWESSRPGEVDLEIIKHRYGPQRRTTLAFQGHYARFVDLAS